MEALALARIGGTPVKRIRATGTSRAHVIRNDFLVEPHRTPRARAALQKTPRHAQAAVFADGGLLQCRREVAARHARAVVGPLLVQPDRTRLAPDGRNIRAVKARQAGAEAKVDTGHGRRGIVRARRTIRATAVVLVLAGRARHARPAVCPGVAKLACAVGAARRLPRRKGKRRARVTRDVAREIFVGAGRTRRARRIATEAPGKARHALALPHVYAGILRRDSVFVASRAAIIAKRGLEKIDGAGCARATVVAGETWQAHTVFPHRTGVGERARVRRARRADRAAVGGIHADGAGLARGVARRVDG